MSLKFLRINKFFIKRQDKDIITKIIQWMIIGLVFILPFLFLSLNSYPLELNKILIFQVIILVAVCLFFWKSLVEKKIKISKTYLDWYILFFLFFYLISFIFSKNHYVSLVGISGYYSASIISVLSYILFFYLVINFFKDWQSIKKIIYSFWLSGVIIIVFNLLQLRDIFILPWDFTHNLNFNLIANSSLTLAFFVLIIFVISLGIILFQNKKWLKIIASLVIISSFIILLLLNKIIIIYLLLIILLIWLLRIIFWGDKKNYKLWIIIPSFLIILILIFLFADLSQFAPSGISASVLLSNKISFSIAWNSFLRSPVWGTGPQTFLYDFSQFRPENFNDSTFWNIQFIKSGNEFWNMMATLGLGAALSFLLVSLVFIYRSFCKIFHFKKIDDHATWITLIFLSFFIIFLAVFFIPFNFILYFLFWLLLAVGMSLFKEYKKENIYYEIKLKNKGRNLLVVRIIFIVFLVSTFSWILFSGRVWLADYNFAKAQQNISSGEDMDIIFSRIETAISLNKYESKYYLTLAQGYTTQALLKSQEDNVNDADIQEITQKVIDNINLAKKYDDRNPSVYKKATIIYDSLRPIVGNVDELAVKDYLSAIVFEPNNPLIYFNLGRSRLLLAQTILSASGSETSTEEAFAILDDAILDFEKTRQLKNDYLLIDYNIGLAYQIKGDYNKSLEMFMIELKKYPDSPDIKWQISLAYEQQGEIEKSVMYLEEIILTNANNEIVLKKLEELKNILSKEEINE